MHSLKVYEFDPLLFKITSTALDTDALKGVKLACKDPIFVQSLVIFAI